MMLSAIVLAAGLLHPLPIPVCAVLVMRWQNGHAQGLAFYGTVGDRFTWADVASNDVALYDVQSMLTFDSRPDLILHINPAPGERITIPPVTEQQRRECGGAVS